MRDVAIVGAGQSTFGDHPDASIKELFADSYGQMTESVDHNYDPVAVDAAYIGTLGVGGYQLGIAGALLTSFVGLTGLPVHRVENACASSGFALLNAIQAVGTGTADVALAGGVEKMSDLSSDRVKYWLGVSGDTEYERLAGTTFAGLYAIMTQRYLFETDATHDHLAEVAVKNHANGVLNDEAHFQREITLEDARDAPTVAAPLTLYDACPTSDGAASALVVPAEEAKQYTDTPVYLTGFGAGSDYLALHDRDTITGIPAAHEAAAEAFERASRTPDEIDFAEVHDCFTIAELLAYEDLGFAARGEGWQLIEDDVTTSNGALPINTSGGLKAKGHPLGATGLGQAVEVFKQLRGEAGPRQLDGEVALSHNVGGSGGAATVFVYET